jgi:hypothetical protein
MEKKKTSKSPAPKSRIQITPIIIIKKEFNNLERKSHILPPSKIILKEKDHLSQNSQHASPKRNLIKENDRSEAVPQTLCAIKIKKKKNDNPKDNLNKYLSFYQSSNIIQPNHIRQAFNRQDESVSIM